MKHKDKFPAEISDATMHAAVERARAAVMTLGDDTGLAMLDVAVLGAFCVSLVSHSLAAPAAEIAAKIGLLALHITPPDDDWKDPRHDHQGG